MALSPEIHRAVKDPSPARRYNYTTLPTLRSDCKKAAEINKRENVDWKAQDSGCLERPQVRTRYDKHQDCGLRNIATCEKTSQHVKRYETMWSEETHSLGHPCPQSDLQLSFGSKF